MRNLSQISLAKIAQRFGAEPYLAVGIDWAGTEFFYSDKAVPGVVDAKLLSVNGIEDVTTLAGSTSATNLNILLDDTDGSIKNIFNIIDIHKRPVAVYQCFEGIDFNDRFVIYEGLLESPIVYSDGDRTLSFSVVGMNEHKEVGFSPEEGQFPNLPVPAVGVPWPMAFGTALKCPGLTYQYPAVGTIQYPFYVVDHNLDVYDISQDESSGGPTSSITAEAVPRVSYGGSGEIVDYPVYTSSEQFLGAVAAQGEAILSGFGANAGAGSGSTSLADHIQFIEDQLAAALGGSETPPPPGTSSFIVNGKEYDDHDYTLQLNATWSPGNSGTQGDNDSDNVSDLQIPPSNRSAYFKVPLVKKELEAKKASSTGVQLINNGIGFPVGKKVIVGMNGHVFSGTMDATGYMTLKELYLPKPIPAYGSKNTQYASKNETDVSKEESFEHKPLYLGAFEQSLQYFTPDGSFTPAEYKHRQPYFTKYGEASIGWKLETGIKSDGFQLFEAGSQISIMGDASVDYIVNIFPTAILQVWAYKSLGNVKTLCVVPQDRWQASAITFGTVTAYIVRLDRMLSRYPGEQWDDGIFVDQQSSVGPNPIDIMATIINVYTTELGYDHDSFATARAQLVNYPMNFTISEKQDAISFLQDLAYQCRCAIYIKNRVFFVKYLSIEPTPDDTITIDDVIEGSIQVSTTETEQLTTRLSGGFSSDYSTGVKSQVIVRNNISKYGLFKEDHNFFAYTHGQYVQKSVTYWVIQRSNIWKRIKFSTPLHKLNLETFDSINFYIPGHVSIGPVTCRIESTQYDSVNNKIDFDCWVPVRLGEMEPFKFAYPAQSETDFSDIYLKSSDPVNFNDFRNLATGLLATVAGQQSNSASGGGGDINGGSGGTEGNNTYFGNTNQIYRDAGEPVPSDRNDQPVAQHLGNYEQFGKPMELPYSNKPANPDNLYRNTNLRAKPLVLNQIPDPGCVPGFVTGSGEGNNFCQVDIYPNGLTDANAVQNVKVYQMQISADDKVPVGTAVLVSRVCVKKTGGPDKIEIEYAYYMQVPVWLE